ncbi:hypothetical protein AJ79_06445 [Helicocarpus griseus UAMH5409]|uniref:Monopolin complex subunit Csm1/Pcs1 C-terminal domain-containing protein n=1 Tax=Helicocarpus griseus UAMH5409 TaxID=1447875 RepID=A0A2B7XDI0_9EURO|nr:hypothetical protein AJ79_06445 [Helicocarpus griseus UAMH5409]
MPKRKAASKLSGLVDDYAEDVLLMNGAAEHTHDDEDPDTAPPPAKKTKGRPKATATKTTAAAAKPATRKARSTVVVGPRKRAPAKATTTRRGRKPAEEPEEQEEVVHTSYSKDGDDEGEDEHADEAEDEPEQVSDDELDSPKTTMPATRGQTNAGTKQKKGPVKRVTMMDGEFEYTPMGTRKTNAIKPAAKAKAPAKPATRRQKLLVEPEVEEEPEEEIEEEGEEEVEETILQENNYPAARSVSRSPTKSLLKGRSQPRFSQPAVQRRRAGGASGAEKESEATLRRKLGDMTKKYENMDLKYRNLREIGILEANANVEKLRKQCEANTAASNQLIASLKKELAMQTTVAKESLALQKQLEDRDDEVAELEAKVKQMSSSLASAQNEVKSLQTKLAASRTAATNVESVTSKGPGSAAKNGPASRTLMVGSAEAAQAAQIAQLKEDLYSDLTGLIIRDAKKRESDHLYDCIQTGINGTLHFKLAVAHDVENTSFEEAEFQYSPLLDTNRDRDLLKILPEYLTIDITFPRQHASVFYSRVVDTLTKKKKPQPEE